MDLMCTSTGKINFLYVVWLVSLAAGGLLFFAVPDRIGRRKTHYIFSTLNLIA